MLNKISLSYDKMKKIKNINNRTYFKSYLTDIFNGLSTDEENYNNKVINKITFMDYIGLPYFIADKLFNVISPLSNNLTLDNFVRGLDTIYNGSLEDTEKMIFNLYDFDNDGEIVAEDVRFLISFVLKFKNNANDLSDIIDNFFDKKRLNFEEFINKIEYTNSDIYFVIIYFIIDKAPFKEKSLDIYQMDYKRADRKRMDSLEDVNDIKIPKKTRSARNSLITPTNNLANLLNIDTSMFIINETNSEDELLCELENTTIEIKLDKFNTKTLKAIDDNICINTKIKSKEEKKQLLLRKKSLSENNILSYNKNDILTEGYVYIFIKKDGETIKKKRWLLLIEKDLYYFTNSSKGKIKKLRNLSGSFIREDINTFVYNDEEFYSFTIVFNQEIIHSYYCKFSKESKMWIINLKEKVNHRNINNDYKFLNTIGQGGFGKVELAEKISNGQSVAIKIYFKKDFIHNLEDIKTEIEILKFCTHKNIVNYIDSYEDEFCIYLVQEYMNSGDLTKYLKNEKLLGEDNIKNIIYQIAEGLNYLHNFGIIHRDLKPQNILINKENNKISVKICDFGLSKFIGVYGKGKGHSGTLHFSSPEVIMNKKYTSKIDIWSLGIISYFLFFGVLPFDSNDSNEKILERKICKENYNIPNGRSISDEAKNFLKNCLEKNQERRFNIKELLSCKWLSS